MYKPLIRKKRVIAGLAASLMLIVAGQAVAWDGVVSGTLVAIDVTGGGNFGLRVYLSGVTAACTSGPNWGYLNASDSNYTTYAAALLMAKAQGSPVNVYSTLENGYCHIGYITIQ